MMFYRKEYKIISALILIFSLTVLPACSGISVQSDYFFTMDTFAETTIITKKSDTGKEANAKIKEICEDIENRISNKIEMSEIYKLNDYLEVSDGSPVTREISNETAKILETAKYMKEQTNGLFNPNLGEIIDLWNVSNKDENYIPKLPEKDDFYPALERVQTFDYEITDYGDGYYIESQSAKTKFDLGAIGKGYAIDEISDYFVEAGISRALVSFGSSILAAGKTKTDNLWAVGLKDPMNPDDPEKISGVLSVTDKVISVSGGYERFITIDGIDYGHIIDPETGYPVNNDLLCVVVVMNSQSALQTKEQREKTKNNGAVADALSTALYVMGKDNALKFYNTTKLDFEMILYVRDNSPRGYEIIPTNVIFTEITETTEAPQ